MKSVLFARRGAIAIMTALLAVPLIAMMGLAVDVARISLVKSRLQMSLDAAVLVEARDISTCGTPCSNLVAVEADGVALFWADFSRASSMATVGFLGATATTPLVTPAPGGVSGSVLMTSTATVSLTLLGVLGIQPVTVSAASTAQTAATGLELALVLDNTGSMATNNAMASLITAAQQLVGIVYGGKDTQPNLWVSVVPFTAAVNIGNAHTNWLVSGSLIPANYAPSKWMGCVMARTAKTGAQAGDDFNDNPPVSPDMFEPFLYPSTYHVYSYTTGKVTNYYEGDNDWNPATWTAKNNEPDTSNNSMGPNLDCPSLPILPETASKTTVLATINQMIPIDRGGTFINLGLQAGWWTLSPRWQGLWGLSGMPLAYKTPYMQKVIVLMTDGQNEWYDWPSGAPGAGPAGWVNNGDADFTAYGRLLTNTLGLAANQANITTDLNNWMSTMCTTLKQNGIIIYTILFNSSGAPSAATVTLFTNCASPGNYHYSPTGTDLENYFSQIGSQLSNLRISQ